MMNDRIAYRAIEGIAPDTLASEELEVDREPLTRAPTPRPVRAWVRYAGTLL